MQQYPVIGKGSHSGILRFKLNSEKDFNFCDCMLKGPFLYIQSKTLREKSYLYFLPYYFIRKGTFSKEDKKYLDFLPVFPDLKTEFFLLFSDTQDFNQWVTRINNIRDFFYNKPTYFLFDLPVTLVDSEKETESEYNLNFTPEFIKFIPPQKHSSTLFLSIKSKDKDKEIIDYCFYLYPTTNFVSVPSKEITRCFVIKHNQWPIHIYIKFQSEDHMMFAFTSFYILSHNLRSSKQVSNEITFPRPITFPDHSLNVDLPKYKEKTCSLICPQNYAFDSPTFSSPILIPAKASTSLELLIFEQKVSRRIFVSFPPSIRSRINSMQSKSIVTLSSINPKKKRKTKQAIINFIKNSSIKSDYLDISFNDQLKRISNSIPKPSISDIVSHSFQERPVKESKTYLPNFSIPNHIFQYSQLEYACNPSEEIETFPEFEKEWEAKGFSKIQLEEKVIPGDYVIKIVFDLSVEFIKKKTHETIDPTFQKICFIIASILFQGIDTTKFFSTLLEVFKTIPDVYYCIPIPKSSNNDIFQLFIILVNRLIVFRHFSLFFSVFTLYINDFYSSSSLLRNHAFCELFRSTIAPLTKLNWDSIKISNLSFKSQFPFELPDLSAANHAHFLFQFYIKGLLSQNNNSDPHSKFTTYSKLYEHFDFQKEKEQMINDICEYFKSGYISPPHAVIHQIRHCWYLFCFISKYLDETYQEEIRRITIEGSDDPDELFKNLLNRGLKNHCLWKWLITAAVYGRNLNFYKSDALIFDAPRLHYFLEAIYMISNMDFD